MSKVKIQLGNASDVMIGNETLEEYIKRVIEESKEVKKSK